MEFEIKFIWSIASGKHQLFVDNICISSSMLNHSTHQQRSTNKFDHTFNVPESILPGGHILHITAFFSNLNLGGQPQHMLKLDGQMYDQFYNIYQLGGANMMSTYGTILDKLKASGACRVATRNERRNAGNTSPNSITSAPSRMNSTSDLNNNIADDDVHSEDYLVRGRPRYRPNSHNRSQSSGRADPRINRNGHGGTDRYWERPPTLPGMRYSPKRTSQNTSWNPNKFNHQDVARNDEEEKKFIAQAMVHSFRDLRGVEQSYNHHEDDMSIPTFARPPRVITSKNNNRSSNSQHNGLKAVKETSPMADLLDENHNIGQDDQFGNINTHDVDNSDGISVLTGNISHLDPKQMEKTQQNLSFRLQAPPVYADSTAGDLMQPGTATSHQNVTPNQNQQQQPAFGMNMSNAPSTTSFAAANFQQANFIQQQQQQQQQQQYYQGNTTNATGSHVQMGFINQPNSPHQRQQPAAHQSLSQQNMSFVAAPAPTWDALNNAFDPLSTR